MSEIDENRIVREFVEAQTPEEIAAILAPGQLLMVALTAYFLLLLLRFLSPRLDGALVLRKEESCQPE